MPTPSLSNDEVPASKSDRICVDITLRRTLRRDSYNHCEWLSNDMRSHLQNPSEAPRQLKVASIGDENGMVVALRASEPYAQFR